MDRGERPKLDQETSTVSSVPEPSTPQADHKQRSQVERVLSYLRHRYCAHGDELGPWIEFQLAEGEFEEIQRELQKDADLLGFVLDKIRYNYFANLRLLVVRRPTPVHHDFLRNVANALWIQVTLIRQGDGEAAVFARNIRDSGSYSIRYKEGSWHDPDASYRFKGVKRPPVIIEVSNSQKKKYLPHLANDYIIDSNGGVQVVVGLDIEFGRNKTHAASLSVWRPRFSELADGPELRAEQTVVDQLFREDNGRPTSYPGITLHLSDFAPGRFSKNLSSKDDVEINISCRQLCKFLDEAEEAYEEEQALPEASLPAGTTKRKLSKTPPQELTSADEKPTPLWRARK